MEISRAAVIGAGVMGSGIAAHFANAGVPVVVLDVVPGAASRALERLARTEPAPLMRGSDARLITPGDLERDLGLLAGADWIVEAIVEDVGAKSALYRRLEEVIKPDAIVSSNTSTIPLAALIGETSGKFRRHFLITHFFNPPRYMRLLEVVAGPDTAAEALAAIGDFADRRLGKGVVFAKDTPGFIANRIGAFWIQAAINAAFAERLSVEEADAIAGAPMGAPKTGVFGLMDLVGLDLMPRVAESLLARLPADDAYRGEWREHPLITRMIAEGFTGRKGRGGFYRVVEEDGVRRKEAIDLASGAYRPAARVKTEAGGDLPALLRAPDAGGRFARTLVTRTLAYAAGLVPEIADTIEGVDQAMRLGYNWTFGPFALIDRLGAGWFADLCREEGVAVPALVARAAAAGGFYRVDAGRLEALSAGGGHHPITRADGVLALADIRRAGGAVWKNASAAVWDLGDGVLCLEFTTKMNALDEGTMAAIGWAVELIGDGRGAWKALVIHNDGENFSVGANLAMAMFLVNIAAWDALGEMVAAGQRAYRALKYAPFPVVGAPSGLALGGGCEILLHCDRVQAHAESYIGLVEAGVGLVPAWGGTTAMLARAAKAPGPKGPMPPIARVFETLSLAKVSRSAAEARDLGYLGPDDAITMNRDRLLADAKALALALAPGYHPPEPPVFTLPGPGGRAALDLVVQGFVLQGKASPHDLTVCRALAEILTGGDTDPVDPPLTEDALLALERRETRRLIRAPKTVQRIERMLTTGKPLRN